MLIEQEQISFKQEILLKVQQFDLLRNQVELALRAYDVSQKRQELTRNRYYIGKIGITELGIAISEQESARRGYMNALRSFWLAFYELRQITLYDFERNISLVKKIDFLSN
jgi:outer membrane protein TolC